MHVCMYICIYAYCVYYTYIDKPVVRITGAIIGCGYVNISLSTTGNIDECSVEFYDSRVSYEYLNSNKSKRVTVSRVTRVTSSISTIPGLPDDTQVDIKVNGIRANHKILSFDTTSVRTKRFESMCKLTALQLLYHNLYVCVHVW